MFRRILVAFDGSSHAQAALAEAFDLAQANDGRVTVMAVVPQPGAWGSTTAYGAPIDLDGLGKSLEREYQTMLDDAVDAGPADVPVTKILKHGAAAAAILEEACDRRHHRLDHHGLTPSRRATVPGARERQPRRAAGKPGAGPRRPRARERTWVGRQPNVSGRRAGLRPLPAHSPDVRSERCLIRSPSRCSSSVAALARSRRRRDSSAWRGAGRDHDPGAGHALRHPGDGRARPVRRGPRPA